MAATIQKYLTDDRFYCHDCNEVAQAVYVEHPESFACAYCDSANIIPYADRRLELSRERCDFMEKWDALAEGRVPQ